MNNEVFSTGVTKVVNEQNYNEIAYKKGGKTIKCGWVSNDGPIELQITINGIYSTDIHPSVLIGKGTIIAQNATIKSGVVLGEMVVINKSAVICEDVMIGDDSDIEELSYVTIGE